MNGMAKLAEQCEAATGPDRELDLAIKLALEPGGDIARVIKDRRGFDGNPGMAWELYPSAVCFQKRDEGGRCFFNGGYPLPEFTASIDAALPLAEDLRGLSLHRRSNPDMGGRDWLANAASHRSAARSWALALCAIGLRYRATWA